MKNKLNYIFIAVPILFFLCTTIWYSQNIPYNDDYPSILGFLLRLREAGSAKEVLQLYRTPYGEHPIFFVRFISWLQLTLSGHLNFAVLPLVGNLGLVIAYIFLLRSVKIEKDKRLFYLLPTAFFIFQLQSWSNNIWSMASLSNTLIFCWIILSLYYFFRDGNSKLHFIAGLIFAVCATCTNGNGVFVLATAGITFLCQRKYGKGFVVLGLFLCLFLNILTQSKSGSILDKIMHQGLPKTAGMFLTFLGSNFFYPSFFLLALGTGIVFVSLFVYLFFAKKYYLVNPVAFSLFSFIFITGIAVATQRELLDINTVAPSRYRIYGTLLITLSYIACLEVFPKLRNRRLIGYVAFPVAILFFMGSNYVAKGKMENRNALNRAYLFMINNNIYLGQGLDSTYKLSLQEGLIKEQEIPISSLLLPQDENIIVEPAGRDIIYHIDTTGNKGEYLFIKGWAGKSDNSNSLNSIHTLVYSKGKIKAYKANFLEVPDFINNKKMFAFATCGFLAVVPAKEYLEADSVVVGMARDIRGQHIAPFYFTNNKN